MENDLDLTDEQIDELVNAENVPHGTEEEVPAQAPAYAPIKFTANGKEIVADDPEKLKQWASMGYNYGQHINEFKKQQEEFSTRQKDFDSKYALYEQIDQAAQKNPDWWEHVNNSFKQRSQEQPGPTSQNQGGDQSVVEPIVQKLQSDFEQFRSELLAEKQALQAQQEDQALKQQIQSIREKHQDLDWSTPNEEGKTLEYRVLEHAKNNDIGNFDIAFKSLMHDELINRTRQQALDAARKEIQRNHKLGLLGESPEPLKKFMGNSDPKNSSWDELELEALKEMGLAN